MKLSKNRFENIKSAIFANARPLDIELYKYKFENGKYKSVIKELMKYQNDDGGFGYGIEPDIRLKASSPIATTVGIQYCLKIDLSTNHEIFQSAMQYFLDNLNQEDVYWPNAYEDVNKEPHAPWWQVKKIIEPTSERWANANAEIAGYLFKVQDKTNKVTKLLENKIKKILDQTEFIEGLYNLMCWERGLPSFPSEIQDKTRELIIKSYKNISPLTQEKMGELRIFFLTRRPSDLVNEILPKEVSKMLDDEIKTLDTHDGCVPTWEWGIYPEFWATAKKEWIGKMTLDFLITLENYGRIGF